MSSVETYTKPRWLRDLLRFLPLKSQFVLSGNVRDLQTQQVAPGVVAAVSLSSVLAAELGAAGFLQTLSYEPVAGFKVLAPAGDASNADAILSRFGLTAANGTAAAGLDLLGLTLERVVTSDGQPTAVILDFASRLVTRTDSLSPLDPQLFTRALVLSQSARARPVGVQRSPLFNALVWVVDKE